jgi:hypothetical protein
MVLTSRARVAAAATVSGLVVAISLSGCAGSSDGSSPSRLAHPSSAPSVGAPADPSTMRAVRAAYSVFFDSRTAASRSAAYLQHGDRFRSVLEKESTGSDAQKSSAVVSSVRLVNGNLAKVTFSIKGGGASLLSDVTGYAVRETGQWKVAAQTFCGLLKLEGVTASACRDAAATTLPK